MLPLCFNTGSFLFCALIRWQGSFVALQGRFSMVTMIIRGSSLAIGLQLSAIRGKRSSLSFGLGITEA